LNDFLVRVELSIFETIGLAYVILATAIFTIELIYCSVKGVSALHHLLTRGQGGPERRKSETDKDKKHFFRAQP
jgi:hypothetical protein